MKVQLYDDGMARVFDRTGNGICDVWARGNTYPAYNTKGIDAALKRVRMRRVGKWKHYPEGGFKEAMVRFDSPKTSVSRGDSSS